MKRMRIPHLLTTVLLATLVACADPVQLPRAVEVVAEGRAHADLLERQARTGVDAGPRVDLERAYLERLRLGLGSPFRLMEQALLDDRLSPQRRRLVAAALLARTLDGDLYRIDPAALDVIVPPYASADSAVAQPAGESHLRLIQEAVREATDPRAGELAVRLAFLMAQADATVDARGARLGIQVAGQVLDRELARRDAARLLAQARRSRLDPLALVSAWRAERRFEVERPRLATPARDAEKYAMRLGPRLADALRGIASGEGAALRAETRPSSAPTVSAPAARRLLMTLDSAAAPPQAPVAVTIGAIVRGMPDAPAADDPATPVLESLTDEERYALGSALISAERPELRPFMSRVSVWVGTALRPYAQERVWPVAATAPASRELAREFGLAAVDFDASVPAEWRPHYRRLIHEALLDMQRVLPALDLRRLSVRVGPTSRSAALAVHDPATRTIHLPPSTGAGTLAHEIAHDLDWQVALKRYRVRGDYGSDQAARRPTDHLSATFQGLTGAVLVSASPVPIDRASHQTRPAEVFARSIDWLVASALAREGRSNGYLSSVQDDLLTGYGTVMAPDITGRAGAALVSILDEVAPLHADTRAWFLREYGPGRSLTAVDLIRQVTQAPERSARSGEVRLRLDEALELVRHARGDALEMGVCTAGSALDPEIVSLRRQLVQEAAEARARGLAMEAAARSLGPGGPAWLSARLEPGPWPAPADSTLAERVRSLAERVRSLEPEAEPVARDPFRILDPGTGCRPEGVFGDLARGAG